MTAYAFLAVVLACITAVSFAGGSAVFQSGAYDNVVVAIKDSVPVANCKTIVNNVEVSVESL